MGLTIIKSPCTEQQLDQWSQIAAVPPDQVVHSEELTGFGIDDGGFCADPICLPAGVCQSDICAAALHYLDGAGEIKLWQSPVRGQSCTAGQICIDMEGWSFSSGCCAEPEKPDWSCDPCGRLAMLKRSRDALLDCDHGRMTGFTGKSTTVRLQAVREEYLDKQIEMAEAECHEWRKCHDPCYRAPNRRNVRVRVGCR